MKVIKATQQMLETRTLVLGFQGENLRTQLRIDCASTFAEYPNATPALAIKPSSGETYPVFVERDGNEVVWDIVANNLLLKGDGELQLTFYKGDVIAKTSIGHITVNRSLQIDGEMPDVVATWIENANRKLAEVDAQIVELEGMVDTATDAATRAEQSASTASTKAEQAAGSAATATEKATEATNAAGTATAKAAEAALSATQAGNSAMSAADSERGAIAKAAEATTAAGTATTKATEATEAAQTATEKAGDASASATAAHASEINAAESADDALSAEVGANAAKRAAEASATQAGTSERNAGTAAQTATQKAAEATQSATDAATFAGTATTKAEEAAASAQAASDAKTAVEQTAEQLADSLEQIAQNTHDIADHEQYAEATYAKKTDLSNLTSDLDLVQTSGTIVETDDAFPTFAEDVTAEIVPVQSGSGDPSPENVRPITGFDSVKVSRTGKNLLPVQMAQGSSLVVVLGQSDTSSFGLFLKAGTYTISVKSAKTFAFYYRAENGTENVHIGGYNVTSATFTLAEDLNIRLYAYLNAGLSVSDISEPQLELGSTATAYEPYNGVQVELPFGQTVYGGQIDLTTGKLTVDRAMYTANGNETLTQWQLIGTSANIAAVITYIKGSSAYANYADGAMNAMCDRLPQVSNVQMYMKRTDRGVCIMNNKRIALQVDGITTLNEMSAWLAENKPTFVYKLATPLTYTLTPAQVLLLRDYNVLWANTGDIINLEYRAGTFVTKKTYDALKAATLIHNTASGAIASFPDGAEMPVDEVTTQINPVQDLHGYDHPWPSGGGKNLCMHYTDRQSNNGITYAPSLEGIEIKGTATGPSYSWDNTHAGFENSLIKLPAGTYTFSSNASPGDSQIQGYIVFMGQTESGTDINNFVLTATSLTRTVTFSENVGIYYGIYVANGITANLTVKLQIESGSTATAWTPYSNICPISGFEGLTVTRTGRNLFDQDNTSFLSGNVRSYGNSDMLGLQQINTLPAGTYTLSFSEEVASLNGIEPVPTRLGLYLRAFSNGAVFNVNAQTDTVVPSVGYKITKSVTFTLTEEYVGKFMYFYVYSGNNNAHGAPNEYTAVFSNIQLELGTTATDYEPYQGETYEVEFPSEAGTVYGGSLTIAEDGSGVLTVDRAYDQMTFEWLNTRDSSAIGFQSAVTQVGGNSVWVRNWNYANAAPRISGGIKAICNAFPISMHNTTIFASQYRIYFGVGSIETIEEFKAAVQSLEDSGSGLWIAYELATPLTYTLTASQITTLLGENNLWHDANGDISVGYKANTKLYIDNKIAELVARIVNS